MRYPDPRNSDEQLLLAEFVKLIQATNLSPALLIGEDSEDNCYWPPPCARILITVSKNSKLVQCVPNQYNKFVLAHEFAHALQGHHSNARYLQTDIRSREACADFFAGFWLAKLGDDVPNKLLNALKPQWADYLTKFKDSDEFLNQGLPYQYDYDRELAVLNGYKLGRTINQCMIDSDLLNNVWNCSNELLTPIPNVELI